MCTNDIAAGTKGQSVVLDDHGLADDGSPWYVSDRRIFLIMVQYGAIHICLSYISDHGAMFRIIHMMSFFSMFVYR